ncbi:Peptidoglycan-binding protein ArfA [Defluviimonas aquaemixtae]|uniref:Peptidoglycan-binding protein ArfA n=1 Tax=Albidovulum aquaemixtae TaxID=1542388 RepID=A0A2R8BJ25_9RHOB|nr:OmpA family protein [Defluviimonas aquaemixtae]SPH23405.1 Peptidoglycan-binding protein ArfA [Defluviimonas aquaemixtae]
MRLNPLRTLPPRLVAPLIFALAAGLSILTAAWAAEVVERRSAAGVIEALSGAGHGWAEVSTDGLQVMLSGTAPTETARFRALSTAGAVVDPDRLIDAMDVTDAAAIAAPDFVIEILRNADGISLIGLVPEAADRAQIVAQLTNVAGTGSVTDMLEAASHPVPDGWKEAVEFGIEALAVLPRSKVSISATRISVTAISDSAAEKARIESELSRKAPRGLRLVLDISAPRPVITPFTLRFIIDQQSTRFDACSADSERARDRIIAAAVAAGASGKSACTIGLGVPTPDWAEAVTMGIAALKDLGAGSITYSDADISLIAADTVSQEAFDRVVGELESNLPEVFSLHAVLTPEPEAPSADTGIKEFSATLSEDGRLDLRGRLGGELSREAVESFARARFGGAKVYAAMRLDPEVPPGWPVRVLAALEAMGELSYGSVIVRPALIRITGVTGSTTASDAVARILSDKLGDAQQFDLNIRYDEKLDPLLGLPTDEECETELNQILAFAKINFEPGSAQIAIDAKDTLDKIADRMRDCADFPMEIAGHTDSQGREEMNLSLSQERAEAVIGALMSRRVLTGNLTAVGYGETVPIADNGTDEGREANRRIEFRLLRPASSEVAGEGEDQGEVTSEGGPAIVVEVQTPDGDTIRPRKRPEATD